MLRGSMVVLAFVALAAQAQEGAKAEQREIVGARSAPEPSLGTPSRSSSGSAKGTSDAFADCSLVQTFRSGGVPLVRTYPAPRPVPESPSEQALYVAAVARCGQVYVFQISSQSKDAWAAEQARLEAPNGETLQVNGLFFDKSKWGYGIITIVATAPPGMKISKLKLTLTSSDGRAALLEARNLP